VSLLGDNIDTIKKNTETLIDVSEEVGLEENTEKTKYMLLSHHQTAGQTHDIKIANISLENVAQFKYMGITITNQNLIQDETKRTLNSSNACHHSVQNYLSYGLLSEIVKNRI
jgi:mannitol-specific phosphotransferase system IIBC component